MMMMNFAPLLLLAVVGGSSATIVAPNDPTLVFSPFGWFVTPASATTANTGSYLRTLFTGASCALTFDVSEMVSPPSQVWWRVDNGPWVSAPVAPVINCTVPTLLQSNADTPFHLLHLSVKSMTETANRWLAGPSTRVVFTGLLLAPGAVTQPVIPASGSVLILGDSITEGVRTLGENEPQDTDRNDADLSWGKTLGALLGLETGLVGFGATGLTHGGSGNVPAVGVSFNQYYDGVPRNFSVCPTVTVLNEGTNDGNSDTVAEATALLNALLALCPTTPIVVLRPFCGVQAANWQTAIAACRTPTAATYIDTTGVFNVAFGSDSMQIHPAGVNGVARIAPQLALLIKARVSL